MGDLVFVFYNNIPTHLWILKMVWLGVSLRPCACAFVCPVFIGVVVLAALQRLTQSISLKLQSNYLPIKFHILMKVSVQTKQ